jgi:hypothetical protein
MPLMERSPQQALKYFCEEVALRLRMQHHVFYFVDKCKWIIKRFEAQIRMTRAKHEVLMMFWEKKVSELAMEDAERERRQARGGDKKKQAGSSKATRAVLTLDKTVRADFLLKYLKQCKIKH